jgi:DNA-binding transcriptional regulator YhcF (GntR family)
MIKWHIDKENKIPLYLQLKDLIKNYISTGAIQDNTVLPGVNSLAKELKVNFETVRKAYKEIEKEGLISMKRGKRTYATLLKGTAPKIKAPIPVESEPAESLKTAIKKFIKTGRSIEDARKIIDQILLDVSAEKSKQFIIFTECNPLQVKEISELLKKYLAINVRPVLISELRSELQKISAEKDTLIAIVTTGFHVNETKALAGDFHVDLQILITNMAPETRRKLDAIDKKARFGFICRDKEIIPLYKDLLKAELSEDLNLSSCVFEEKEKVQSLLNSVDVCLVTPPVYEEVKKLAPSHLPLFNVFDRVDPMSLRVLRDRVLGEP